MKKVLQCCGKKECVLLFKMNTSKSRQSLLLYKHVNIFSYITHPDDLWSILREETWKTKKGSCPPILTCVLHKVRQKWAHAILQFLWKFTLTNSHYTYLFIKVLHNTLKGQPPAWWNDCFIQLQEKKKLKWAACFQKDNVNQFLTYLHHLISHEWLRVREIDILGPSTWNCIYVIKNFYKEPKNLVNELLDSCGTMDAKKLALRH